MTPSFADYKAETTPATKSVFVCFDRELLARLEAAERAAKADEGMLSADHATVEEVRTEIETKTRELKFQAIGKGAWRELMGNHPPTPEQQEDGHDHNPETFPPAAMAASCVEPGMTLEDAQWFCDTFPLAVVNRVWATVLEANVLGGDEKKAVTARPRTGERTSTLQSV